jgi:prephenate dehydratase
LQAIGFLGPEGTHTQQAALNYTVDHPAKLSAFPGLSALLQAVQSGALDAAVIPIENSLEGAVNLSLDLLAWEVDLLIIAEIVLPISHCLLVNEGTTMEALQTLFTHPQASGQCRKFLEQELPQVSVSHSLSTAEGARLAKAGGTQCAAIAPRQAGELYGMQILRDNIQDQDNNFTRFAVIGNKTPISTGRDKTSLVFSTDHHPGSLYRILDIFSLWNLNMTKIESRPARSKLGTYIFFIDLEGHVSDHDMMDALTMVQRKTTFYKFLGSYPQAE